MSFLCYIVISSKHLVLSHVLRKAAVVLNYKLEPLNAVQRRRDALQNRMDTAADLIHRAGGVSPFVSGHHQDVEQGIARLIRIDLVLLLQLVDPLVGVRGTPLPSHAVEGHGLALFRWLLLSFCVSDGHDAGNVDALEVHVDLKVADAGGRDQEAHLADVVAPAVPLQGVGDVHNLREKHLVDKHGLRIPLRGVGDLFHADDCVLGEDTPRDGRARHRAGDNLSYLLVQATRPERGLRCCLLRIEDDDETVRAEGHDRRPGDGDCRVDVVHDRAHCVVYVLEGVRGVVLLCVDPQHERGHTLLR
eukprot:PhM_4_TR18849/c0_g2_i1/m.100423